MEPWAPFSFELGDGRSKLITRVMRMADGRLESGGALYQLKIWKRTPIGRLLPAAFEATASSE
jgi:hypothetical protein